ncbi:adenylate kinase [candidate division TA06 bacterium]|uniref:Adenylate kinase n=1 Tax=candidate division TA06 bacterium TaxID=2250710 RepID=A0A660S8A9_UNCT6|nr:MAG: adenylate kinase [candidate division TA06 bacterium]
MNIILLGPPGVGKGTQAVIISKEFNLCNISTGDILRESIKNGDDFGKKIKHIVESGALVPDNMIIELIESKMKENKSYDGFLFDGFPRTVKQAEGLDKLLERRSEKVDAVIAMNAGDDIIIDRLLARRVCPQCGTVYNLLTNPPKDGKHCDVCGSELIVRKDDNRETILHRLEVYRESTAPLLEYYKDRLITIDGSKSVSDVASSIIASIGRFSNANG